MKGAYQPLAMSLGPICDLCWLHRGLVIPLGGWVSKGKRCRHGVTTEGRTLLARMGSA